MADVVLHEQLLHQRPGFFGVFIGIRAAQRPARHGRVQEQGCVSIAFVIVHRVQRTQAQLDLGFHALVQRDHRNAEDICLQATGIDGLL